jgi:hypothetical protein
MEGNNKTHIIINNIIVTSSGAIVIVEVIVAELSDITFDDMSAGSRFVQ